MGVTPGRPGLDDLDFVRVDLDFNLLVQEEDLLIVQEEENVILAQEEYLLVVRH